MLRSAVSELGRTIVMVTHDPIAAAYAVVFLRRSDRRQPVPRADASAVGQPHGSLGGGDPAMTHLTFVVPRMAWRSLLHVRAGRCATGCPSLGALGYDGWQR
jgi:hypothetical protein